MNNLRIGYLKDVSGNNYIGVDIPKLMVDPFLDKLKSILGVDDYLRYTEMQKNRDHGKYHITLIPVHELNMLINKLGHSSVLNKLELILDKSFDDLKFMGLGKASDGDNNAYFIVVKSEFLDMIRESYDLPKKDLHITVGFKNKDIFNVRKNIVISESNRFIRLLGEFYRKEYDTFEFLKEIDNFDGDVYDFISPVDITESTMTFRSGDSKYFTIGLIYDKFMVTAKWESEKKLPIIPNTIISKKFKNI